MGYDVIFLLSDNELASGKVICTSAENLNMYYVNPNDSDFARAGFEFTTDELGLIGVHTEAKYSHFVSEMYAILGVVLFAEYFEVVLPLLDALNNVTSNRVDGIEQFIQSLAIAVNCDFPDGTTADDIKQAGLLVLKSIGENKADFKVLSQELNQQQTQTLVDYINYSIDKIVGLPSQANGNTSDSSNNGAVILKNGWQGAEARAKDREIIFKESETKTLKFILNVNAWNCVYWSFAKWE